MKEGASVIAAGVWIVLLVIAVLLLLVLGCHLSCLLVLKLGCLLLLELSSVLLLLVCCIVRVGNWLLILIVTSSSILATYSRVASLIWILRLHLRIIVG